MVAAPAPITLLRAAQPPDRAVAHLGRNRDASSDEFAKCCEDARSAIRRIRLVDDMLVPEPKRAPRAIGPLLALEKFDCPRRRPRHAPLQGWRQLGAPDAPRAECMCRQIRAASVERKSSPTAAESGDSAIGILKIEQPARAFAHDVAIRCCVEGVQSEQRAGRVVSVWNAARQIGPCPPSGSGVRERMADAMLLLQ